MERLEQVRSKVAEVLGLSDEVRRRLEDDLGATSTSELGPARSEDDVTAFEASIGVALPEEYRAFLRGVGDGPLGPSSGLRRLGDPVAGHLHPALPFELDRPVVDDPEGEYPEGIDVVDAVSDVWRGQGALVLADYGCGMAALLVVQGDHRGEVWFWEPNVAAITPWGYWSALHGPIDELVERHEWPPSGPPPPAYGFLDWYEEWLDAVLRAT